MIASDSLALNTSRDAHVGTWWVETVIVGIEWDQALFTKILNEATTDAPQVQHFLIYDVRKNCEVITLDSAFCFSVFHFQLSYSTNNAELLLQCFQRA